MSPHENTGESKIILLFFNILLVSLISYGALYSLMVINFNMDKDNYLKTINEVVLKNNFDKPNYVNSEYINSEHNKKLINDIIINNEYIKSIIILDHKKYLSSDDKNLTNEYLLIGDLDYNLNEKEKNILNEITFEKEMIEQVENLDNGEKVKKIYLLLKNGIIILITLKYNNILIYNNLILVSLLFSIVINTLINFKLIRNNLKTLSIDKNKDQFKEYYDEYNKNHLDLLTSFLFKFENVNNEDFLVISSEGIIARRTGLTTKKLKGKYIKEAYPEYIANSLYDACILIIENDDEVETTFKIQNKFFNVCLKPIYNEDNESIITDIVGYAIDITKMKTAEEKAKTLAYTDILTKLYNRASFTAELKKSIYNIEEDEMLGILVLDLDNFKNINDTLGHDIGDKLLIQVARRLESCVREGDIVARMGGDEFTILLNRRTEYEEVESVANKIIKEFAKSFDLMSSCEYFVTTSIGISLAPYDGSDEKTLFKHADIAMYKAKKSGKNKFMLFNIDMLEEIEERIRIETDLMKALDNNEIYLEYQPLFDLKTNKIISLEALIRWNHPIKGTIYPGEFIHFAEETGLMVPIGHFVFEEACKKIKWLTENNYNNISVSVNLSNYQFKQQDLVLTIKKIIDTLDINSELLTVEITESTSITNIKHTIKTLENLRGIGINISIDDFGTGYSSLSYLRDFSLNSLKIDRSFIQQISSKDTNSNGYIVVKSVLALANNLGLTVIAEGIETEEQLKVLKSLNCKIAQGFLLSKPLTDKKLEEFLNETNKISSVELEELL